MRTFFFSPSSAGVETQLLIPEGLVEPFEERCGFPSQIRCTAEHAEFIEYFRHAQPGVIDIALQLAERLRSLDKRSVRINHTVSGILPAHILVADRRAGLIFLESIAVAITVIVYPGQASLRGLKMPIQQRLVARCPPGRMECDQIERRRIGRAVIWRVRDQFEMSEFSVPHFMQDFARLRVTIVVPFLRL